MRQTQVIAIANQKGGVGKTTTCVNLAGAFLEQGKKILLIDNDPQANLTSYLNRSLEALQIKERSTLDELYLSKKTISLQEAKAHYLQSYQVGLDFISADKNLAGVEYYLYARSDRELVLKSNLQWALGDYDYILIDNPPSLNLLTMNALVASQNVLIPVQTEFFSLEGVDKMQSTIQMIKDRWNSSLKILGILPTQVDCRKKLTSEVLSILQQKFPTELLATKIRDNSKLAESSGHGKTVFKYAGSSAGAEDYRALAEEILLRVIPKTQTTFLDISVTASEHH